MNKSNYHLDRYVNKLGSILGRPTPAQSSVNNALYVLKPSDQIFEPASSSQVWLEIRNT